MGLLAYSTLEEYDSGALSENVRASQNVHARLRHVLLDESGSDCLPVHLLEHVQRLPALGSSEMPLITPSV